MKIREKDEEIQLDVSSTIVSHLIEKNEEDIYAQWESRRGRILVIVTMSALLSALSSTVFLPAIPVLIDYFDTNEFMLGITFSAYYLLVGSLPMVWGPLSDRYSRKITLVAGILIHSLTSILCGFSWNIEMLIVFRIFQAIGGSSLLVIGAGIVSDIYPPHIRGDALGLFTMAPAAGPLIGPTVGGLIAEFLSWQWVFWSLGITSFLIGTASFFFIPETLRLERSKDREHILYAITRPLRFLLTPGVIAPSLGNAICHSTSNAILIIYPILLAKFDLNQLYTGLCYVPIGGMAVIGSKVGGLISDKTRKYFGRGGILLPTLYGVFFYFVCSIQFGFSEELWVIIVAVALCGFFFAFQRPGVYAYVIEIYPNNSSSVSASLLFLQFGLGFVAITVGPLIWTTQEGKLLWFVTTGILAFLLSIPVVILIVRNWNK